MDQQDAQANAYHRPRHTNLKINLIGWLLVLGLGALIYWQRTRLGSELWGAFTAVAGVTIVDAAAGWGVALQARRFTSRRLLEFLRTNLLPQTTVLFALTLVAGWLPAARAMVLPAAGMMVAVYGIDIKHKLTQLMGSPENPQAPPTPPAHRPDSNRLPDGTSHKPPRHD